MDTSLKTINLTSSIVIYPPYLYNHHFLPPSIVFILTLNFYLAWLSSFILDEFNIKGGTIVPWRYGNAQIYISCSLTHGESKWIPFRLLMARRSELGYVGLVPNNWEFCLWNYVDVLHALIYGLTCVLETPDEGVSLRRGSTQWSSMCLQLSWPEAASD